MNPTRRIERLLDRAAEANPDADPTEIASEMLRAMAFVDGDRYGRWVWGAGAFTLEGTDLRVLAHQVGSEGEAWRAVREVAARAYVTNEDLRDLHEALLWHLGVQGRALPSRATGFLLGFDGGKAAAWN